MLREQLKRPEATVNQRLRLADLLVQLGRSAEAVPVFMTIAEELAADGFTARAIAALKRVEKLDKGRPDVEARLSALALQGRSMSILPGATPIPLVPPPPPHFEIGIEEVGNDTLARRQDESQKRALRRVVEAAGATARSAAAPSVSESAGTSEATAFAPIETPAVHQAAAGDSTAPESVAAQLVDSDIIARESAFFEPPDPAVFDRGGVEPLEFHPPLSLPTESLVPEPVQFELPISWPKFPGQPSPEPPLPETAVTPPLRADPIEPAPTQPPSAESPEPAAPSGVAKRLRGVFRRFLAALPVSPTEPSPPALEKATEAAPAPPPEVPTGQSEPPGDAAQAESAAPSVPTDAETGEGKAPAEAQAEVVAAPPAPEVPTGETGPQGKAAATEIPAPVVESNALPEAPVVTKDVAADAEKVSEPLEEDLPTLDLEDVPTSESQESEDELPTLDLAEEEADKPESGKATADPVTSKPVSVPAVPDIEAVAVSAARAPRTTRAGELEAFISLSEDVFQDQVADLIEEMLVPGGESPVPAAGGSPAPARSLLTGPLFEGLSDDERVALVRGLKLRTYEPGDVVLTEGESGSSLFLLTAGAVRVFVRNPAGRNLLLDDLGEGDFFGEISLLSGRPRNATVTAAALCEMLELDQVALAEIERRYPHVSERLQSFSHQRAVSTEAAALREGGNGPGDPTLESHFDDGRLEPRLRLKLADAFLKAGKDREAAQVLIELADDLVRRGQNEKAVALLKKVEQLQHRPRGPAHRPASSVPAPGKGSSPNVDDRLGDWLIDVARDTVRRRSAIASRGLDAPVGQALDPRTLRVYRRGLVASPLFEGLSEDELLALVQGLQLRTVDPGDIILTEGEPGQSIFIVATGQVKVFIRNPAGHDVPLCGLGEGAFFGEISALSGRSRTATVTAAAPSVLLELDPPALEAITRAHPRVQEILETVYIERASDPSAEAIRGQA